MKVAAETSDVVRVRNPALLGIVRVASAVPPNRKKTIRGAQLDRMGLMVLEVAGIVGGRWKF